MALNYGDVSSTRVRLVTTANVRITSISSPTPGASYGQNIEVTYLLESDAGATATLIDVEYTTNGTDWTDCTANATHASHSGTADLAADADGNTYTFVWDTVTDLTTAFQSSTVQVRVRASDGANYSSYTTSSAFTIDMLPEAPTLLSPATEYFDDGDDMALMWTIPADPGADRIHFRIELDDNVDFASPALDHNNVDDAGRFWHEITDTSEFKIGSEPTYYVRDLAVTSFAGTAVLFADLTDEYSGAALTASLTNPQILLVNRNDRRCFIDPSTITATGFTITKSALGVDTNGLVDLLIYTGSAAVHDCYWADLTVTEATAYTLGAGDLVTDVLGNAIPASISYLMPEVLEGSDCGVYLTSVGNTGFTVNLLPFRMSNTATLRVCLRSTPADVYQHRTLTVSAYAAADSDFDSALDDYTDGEAAWPSYVPGPVLTLTPTNATPVILSDVDSDKASTYLSAAGGASTGTASLHGHAWDATSAAYWTPILATGVPDTYEGERAKYVKLDADSVSVGTYVWRCTAANLT